MKHYLIKIPHFYCLEYYEGEKKLKLDIDFRDREIILEPNLITKWEPPYSEIQISYQDKVRILKNIYSYLLQNSSSDRIKLMPKSD